MSNRNILLRLETKFNELVAGTLDVHEFENYLDAAVAALEGVADETIDEARNLGYALVAMGFADEDDHYAPPEQELPRFHSWLEDLKKQYDGN